MVDEPDVDATRSRAPELVAPSARVSLAETLTPGVKLSDEPESYEVERSIGAGGMGTVLAAKGSRLGRSVAVKVVTADRDDLRARFEREARVTAKLQHPAIVPVYATGRYEGQPFYVMKHVTGEPLDRAIAKATTLSDRIALLPKVIAVTEAIAYAHAERVIHRDLKPANILVGAFGETVVIDWGLAKDLSKSEDETAGDSMYRASANETAHGKVMGTPAYMPVEQARGEPVDERADVYALGAILYHVLAGRPPYRREDETSVPWETMVARVLSGPPEPLVTAQPDLPADLLAIVTRAMARSADARYASARDLAEDLRRFQTGQLVGAHRYTTRQLVVRWIKRHRTALSVLAVALVLGAAGGTYAIVRIVDEKRVAEAARAEAETRKTEAERRRDAAEKVMDFSVFTLTNRLRPIGKLSALDGVGDAVERYYEDISKIDPDMSIDGLRRWQEAVRVMAEIAKGKGDTKKLKALHEQSLALAERALASYPDHQAALKMLGLARINLAEVAIDEGKLDEGYAQASKALEAARRRAPPPDQVDDANRDIAVGAQVVANIEQRRGHREAALAGYREFLKLREAALAKHPDDELALHDTAIAHNEIGDVANDAGDREVALAEYKLARDVVVREASMHAGDPRKQADVAAMDTMVGDVLVQKSDFAAAREAYEHARAIREQLVKVDPENAGWAKVLSNSHERLAMLYMAQHDYVRAKAELLEEGRLQDVAVKKAPDRAEWQRDHVLIHEHLSTLACETGDADRCVVEAKLGLDGLLEFGAKHPQLAQDDYIATAYEHLGTAYEQAKRWHDAIDAQKKARELRAHIQASDPDDPGLMVMVADGDIRIGDLELDHGDRNEALAHFRAAVELDDRALTKPNPETATWRSDALALIKLGDALLDRHDPKAREVLLRADAATKHIPDAELTDDDRTNRKSLAESLRRAR